MATAATSKTQTAVAASVNTTIKVRAAQGVRVPVEGAPRKYITDDADVEVTRTAYYLRRLKDGDLVLASTPAAATATAATKASTSAAPVARAPGVASEA